MPEQTLVITSFTLVNDDQLIDAQVQATVYDCAPFSYEKFVGIVTEVKTTKYGKFAYFKTPSLVGGKWIKVDRIIGFAHYEETPAPVAAVEVVPALPAHQTDKNRYTGKVAYVNTATGYGYISEQGGGDIRFLFRNVLGGVKLVKGMTVTYTTGDFTDCALTIVASGNPVSVAAYDRAKATVLAKQAAAQPAKDRAALRKARYAADLKDRAEREKANMAALAAEIKTQKATA